MLQYMVSAFVLKLIYTVVTHSFYSLIFNVVLLCKAN